MQPVIKHVDSFTVHGLTVRTQNSDEMQAKTAKLPKLWEEFYASNPSPEKVTYGIYSDYESDANGQYTVTVGVDPESQSSTLQTVEINAGNYLVFQAKGPMPQTVINTWQHIWDYFNKDPKHKRCYRTDFEAYLGEDEVAIYIGIE